MPKPTHLPNLAWIATGGTLAGLVQSTSVSSAPVLAYQAAQLGPEALLQASPKLLTLVHWHCVQPYGLSSQNLQPEHMLVLRSMVLEQLHNPKMDAVLVTHGTDTLEEMLYFLYLTLPQSSLVKPLLVTAAMLPWNAPGSDGPSNMEAAAVYLHQLCTQTPVPHPWPFGVIMNSHFMAAPWVRKRSTRGVDAFDWPMGAYGEALVSSGTKPDGAEGSMGQYAACLDAQTSSPSNHPSNHPSSGQDDAQSGSQARRLWNTLEVHVLYCTPGLATLKQLQSLSNRVALGDTRVVCVVVAAPGHGNVPELLVPELQRLLAAGVNVVRASRVAEGGVHLGGEPDALGPVPGSAKLPGQVFLQGHLSLGQVVLRERLRSLAVLLAK